MGYDERLRYTVEEKLMLREDIKNASQVLYDNSTSGLSATQVQAAIDELDALIDLITNPLLFKGAISVASDFPTSAEVEIGWFYVVNAAVTDNDPTKTNTGQSFNAGDDIAWDGSQWVEIGVENHNDLSGLQGGTTNEYYHLTNTEYGGDWGSKDLNANSLEVSNSNGTIKFSVEDISHIGIGVTSNIVSNNANFILTADSGGTGGTATYVMVPFKGDGTGFIEGTADLNIVGTENAGTVDTHNFHIISNELGNQEINPDEQLTIRSGVVDGISDIILSPAGDINANSNNITHVANINLTGVNGSATGIVGSELETLSDGSTADALHVHDSAGIVADAIQDTHIDWGHSTNQVDAEDVPYDNTVSGLSASDVQNAIDELASSSPDTSKFLFNLNESLTGLSNEFGVCATPATLVINNAGEILELE